MDQRPWTPGPTILAIRRAIAEHVDPIRRQNPDAGKAMEDELLERARALLTCAGVLDAVREACREVQGHLLAALNHDEEPSERRHTSGGRTPFRGRKRFPRDYR